MRRHYVAHVFLIALLVIILFPVFWVASTSFRRDQAAFSPKIVSSRLTFQHYKDLIFPEDNLPAVILKLQNIVSLSKPYDEMSQEEVLSELEEQLSKLRRYFNESRELFSKSEDAYESILKAYDEEQEQLKSETIGRLSEIKEKLEEISSRGSGDTKMKRLALYTFLVDERFNLRSHSFLYLLKLLADLDETFKNQFELHQKGELSDKELRSTFEKTLSTLSKEYSEYVGLSTEEIGRLKTEITSLESELSSISVKKDVLTKQMLMYEEIANETYQPLLKNLNNVFDNAASLLYRGGKSEGIKGIFVDDEKAREVLKTALNLAERAKEMLPPVDSFHVINASLGNLVEKLRSLVSRVEEFSTYSQISAAYVDFAKIVENSETLLIGTLTEMRDFAENVSKVVSELIHFQEEYASKSQRLEELRAEYATAEEKLKEKSDSLLPYKSQIAALIALNEVEYRQGKIRELDTVSGRNLSRYELYLRKVGDALNRFMSEFPVLEEDKRVFKTALNSFAWVSSFKTFVDKFEIMQKRLPGLLEESERLIDDFETNYLDLLNTRFSGVFVSSVVLDKLYDLVKFDYANQISGALGTVVRYAGDLIYDFPIESAQHLFKQIEGWLYKLGEVWKQKPKHHFLRWVFNSVMVAGIVAIMTTAVCAVAAYPFSRMRFPGRKYGILSLLIIQMFPGVMYMVALYGLLNLLGKFLPWLGLDSLGGLIFVYLGNIAFNMYLIKGFYDTIPDSMEEAAMIDGATRFQTFYKIVIPLASPILAVIVILTFMGTFNEFVLARIILQDTTHYTYAVGLWTFAVGPYETEWGIFTAAALVGMVPMLVLFLSLQRFLISGLTRGAVKG
ncbi:MAG: ABC transporter permease subunit [Thermotogae bacterium]|nr:ABC transporter permease subunit [Thermotogota bacterium]